MAVKSSRRVAGTEVLQTGQRERKVDGEDREGRMSALGKGAMSNGEEGGELREEVGLELSAARDG